MASGQHVALPCQEQSIVKILLTGASGFIGRHALRCLLGQGMDVRAAVRRRIQLSCKTINVGPIGSATNWTRALSGVDAVVHIAGCYRASPLGWSAATAAKLYEVNVEGTRRLAAQSVVAGVNHFVLVSSIGAVCEQSSDLVTAETSCRPVSAYGRSKLRGEQALREEAGCGGMPTTVIRPPLVYGPGGAGSMMYLLKLVNSGVPLPLALVRNRRSFIYVENLVDLIVRCLGNPKVFGKVYLPSDGEDLSTAQLIEKIARANESVQCSVFSDSVGDIETRHTVGRHGDLSALRSGSRAHHAVRLFPFPESLLKAAGQLPGLGALRKLTSSLYVDSEPIRRDLGWTPPFTMEEGLRRMLAPSARKPKGKMSLRLTVKK